MTDIIRRLLLRWASNTMRGQRELSERERFKRKTDELRKLQGKPAWQWRD